MIPAASVQIRVLASQQAVKGCSLPHRSSNHPHQLPPASVTGNATLVGRKRRPVLNRHRQCFCQQCSPSGWLAGRVRLMFLVTQALFSGVETTPASRMQDQTLSATLKMCTPYCSTQAAAARDVQISIVTERVRPSVR